jgi:predicted nucleic-acid-binding protein
VIGLDTNVLLRVVLADEPEQTRRATALLERAAAAGEVLHVPDIVLCELAWVLRRTAGFSRADVADSIIGLLSFREFAIRDPGSVRQAAELHARGDGDFADHLIAATARAAGCEAVATFDEQLQKLPGFVAP